MYGDNKSGMQCTEFELLLADAIDGQLQEDQLARFEQHKGSCPECTAMFADAQAGMAWLKELDEVEPPAHLMNNILAATTGVTRAETTAMHDAAAKRPWWQRVHDALRPVLAPAMTPRFAMSCAMAFFSVSSVLGVAGVKVSDLRRIDLSPKGITHTYYATEARAMKYYESIRLVYEIESRVRELKRVTTPNDNKGSDQKDHKSDKSRGSEPDEHYQNYSRRNDELMMAGRLEVGIWDIARQRRML